MSILIFNIFLIKIITVIKFNIFNNAMRDVKNQSIERKREKETSRLYTFFVIVEIFYKYISPSDTRLITYTQFSQHVYLFFFKKQLVSSLTYKILLIIHLNHKFYFS